MLLWKQHEKPGPTKTDTLTPRKGSRVNDLRVPFLTPTFCLMGGSSLVMPPFPSSYHLNMLKGADQTTSLKTEALTWRFY